ncbi:MAG: Flp pilus assembly protein CpaB [Bryobacteraceae bacterium]|nr:Flp pilus assembly protein CpaB [Bryobacteraceae bacterium]MDW8377091.1 Flp pilus assembly protein CpaB [Bryobacterales bacterium]
MSPRKKSLVPLFGVAFIVAIVSTGIFYGLFVARLDSATATKPQASVLVAARALPAGTELKSGDLQELALASAVRPAGAAQWSEALGKVLVLPLAEKELVTHSHLGQRDGGSRESGGLGIPEGMRAVSVQVQDSAGVVAMLKPGYKVDVQIVASVNTGQYHEPHIRTVLENMQVLTIPSETHNGRGAQVLTLLANPREAAILGLADSTAKVRIVLRNPIDQKRDNLTAVGLTSVFKPGLSIPSGAPVVLTPPSAVAPASALTSPSTSAPSSQLEQAPKSVSFSAPGSWSDLPARPPLSSDVQLWVRLAGISTQAERELRSKLADPAEPLSESMQVAALRPDGSLEEAWKKWESEKAVETLASSRLLLGPKTSAGAQWSLQDDRYGLRVQFASQPHSGTRLRLRVHPEVTYPNQNSVTTRRIETEIEVSNGQSFLVKGFASQNETQSLWERLFPARFSTQGHRELILLVTPKLAPRV